MITDNRRLLEFDRVLETIAGFTHSPVAGEAIRAAAPLPDLEAIDSRFALVEEIRALALAAIRLPLGPYDDIRPLVEIARPDGAVLNPDDLALFLPLLRIGSSVGKLFSYRNDLPLLSSIAGAVSGFPEIRESLEQAIAPDGGLLDTASSLLFSLRKRHRQLTASVRKRLEEIVREREVAIFLQDDFITQRNGRWVIPVRMDSKGMVPGVVHDVSRSGETAFMEPIEVIGMVNELENLGAEEKAEQIRILRELTGWIREEADGLLDCFESVVHLDFLNAIAGFADMLAARRPQMSEEMIIRIDNGCHPLLLLLQKERGGSVVPLTLQVGAANGIRTLLITGPNTGGKTIAIKTAGLLLMMAQTGIPVPADASSIFPATATLAADIGDDQSLEESLSTFSAHVRKTAAIIGSAGSRTLVLLDELGTGTDPAQGGAIACAVLEDLLAKGAIVLATTHLIDIVAFVQRTNGMTNAAMEFDAATLTPCYRLATGEPGQSHAIDTARRCGMPERVLQAATRLAGTRDLEFHALLGELKELRRRHEVLCSEVNERERAAREKEEAAAAMLLEAERRQREAKEQGLIAAKELINSTKADLNRILDEARRNNGRNARQQVAALEERVESELENINPPLPLTPENLAPGARVFVKSLGHAATVMAADLKLQKLRVRAGSIEMEVPCTAVTALTESRQPATGRPARVSLPAAADAVHELNLLGCRVDDALAKVDKFLDSSTLNGLREVRIIHGIGTGTLMQSIREHLSRSPHVRSFHKGEPFAGGDGVTVVELAE